MNKKFDYDKTIILFGRSEFLYKIEKFIPDLLKKYHSIGCNQIAEHFKEIENVIFLDDVGRLNISKKAHLIAPKMLLSSEKTKSFDFIYNHQNKELFDFIRNDKTFSDKKGVLNFYIHTPSLALNWAFLNGFKKVILAGVDLEPLCNTHFASNQQFNLNETQRIKARKHLEKVCTKYLKIFQLNSESNLNLEKISISDLLN